MSSSAAPATAVQRTARMLALVPYISKRPGITLDELAKAFGVTAQQVQADLYTLMMCGEPGYYPDQLIDVVMDDADSHVSIGYDAGITHTVRLSPREVVTLTTALQALAATPGVSDTDAVQSALAKIVAITETDPAVIRVQPEDTGSAAQTVRRALDAQQRLRLTYYTASRDATSTRDVDPIRLLTMDGRSYLEGYCYQAESVRRFRLDRIDAAELLDLPAQQSLWIDDTAPDSMFRPGSDAPTVTMRLARSAAWVAEYYYSERVDTAPDDATTLVRIPGSSDEWIIRLALSLGGQAHIEDRPDLADEVQRRAREALALYESDATVTGDGHEQAH